MNTHLQALFLCFCFLHIAAAQRRSNYLGYMFTKRDSLTNCFSADLEDECSTDPSECVAAMCDACSGVAQIAECCSLVSLSAKIQCCLEAVENPSVPIIVNSTDTPANATDLTNTTTSSASTFLNSTSTSTSVWYIGYTNTPPTTPAQNPPITTSAIAVSTPSSSSCRWKLVGGINMILVLFVLIPEQSDSLLVMSSYLVVPFCHLLI